MVSSYTQKKILILLKGGCIPTRAFNEERENVN